LLAYLWPTLTSLLGYAALASLFSGGLWAELDWAVVGVSVVGYVGLALLVWWQTRAWIDRAIQRHYASGYDLDDILLLGSTAPLVILLLAAPLLGLFPDLVPELAVEVAPEAAPEAAAEPLPGRGLVQSDPLPRTVTPEVEYIAPYVRSNPDGIPENNLSYDGEVPPDTPPPRGYHLVEGHWRTVADGDPDNNLS